MSAAQKAAVLAETLPWLKRFAGRTIVVKYGGHAMDHAVARRAFADDVAILHRCGVRVVVVHGGGPQVTRQLDRLGIESAFSQGRRVTTAEVLDVVRMVLVGQVNRDIVGLLNAHGPLAVGLSGEDARLFSAIQLNQELGLVGEVDNVDPGIVRTLLADGRIPVVATVARGPQGAIYNVNADTAAAALAVALCAEKLVVLTDVAGLLRTHPDPDTLIQSITADELEALLPRLNAGMVPKMEACLRAVRGGLPETRIVDGREPHALLFDLFNDQVGTTVTP